MTARPECGGTVCLVELHAQYTSDMQRVMTSLEQQLLRLSVVGEKVGGGEAEYTGGRLCGNSTVDQ